jgi:DNA-binding PucR family transcriptional regulator
LAGLGLRAAVVADADVGVALRRRYLDPLAESGSGAEIIATLREYLAAGSHVDTAAERLHIHANTLRYRLARFEELTGTHLRGPLTAFEVWWAVESAALDRSGGPAQRADVEATPKRVG